MSPTDKKVELAVFDFDGTSISGNSPVILVRTLMAKRLLKPKIASKIVAWAVAYKMQLPQNEAWVRSQVFSAFDGKPKTVVDAFLREFYHKKIAKRFRPDADRAHCLSS